MIISKQAADKLTQPGLKEGEVSPCQSHAVINLAWLLTWTAWLFLEASGAQ